MESDSSSDANSSRNSGESLRSSRCSRPSDIMPRSRSSSISSSSSSSISSRSSSISSSSSSISSRSSSISRRSSSISSKSSSISSKSSSISSKSSSISSRRSSRSSSIPVSKSVLNLQERSNSTSDPKRKSRICRPACSSAEGCKMDDQEEEVLLVEAVVGKRWSCGGWQYLIKWAHHTNSDNRWECESNVACYKHIQAFNNGEPMPNTPAVARPSPSPTGPKGFERGLPAEKILAAQLFGGRIVFFVQWRGCNVADWVHRDDAVSRCPQKVIHFYQERLERLLKKIRHKQEKKWKKKHVALKRTM